MKKPKVSTGIKINAITPHITAVVYPDGDLRIIYEPLTLEDLENQERVNEWYKAQLEANRGK